MKPFEYYLLLRYIQKYDYTFILKKPHSFVNTMGVLNNI